MVALMDDTGQLAHALDIARRLRAAGINTEVQMEPRKLASSSSTPRAGIRFVVLAGEDELARGVVAVKDLRARAAVRSVRANSHRTCWRARRWPGGAAQHRAIGRG
jgi:histidyl-tRNA synthetase